MRQIRKHLAGPDSLTQHRQIDFADYDNYSDKETLRRFLYEEQRGICCYCMGPITPDIDHMKIEHNKGQSSFPQFQLDYWNLLGACKGNEGQPRENQYCDTHKKEDDISFNPANNLVKIEDSIWYKNDGTIGSSNIKLSYDINNILNLNVIVLKNRRRAALDGFKDYLGSKYKSAIKRSILEKWLSDWKGDNPQEKLKPYCQVIVFWLKSKLKH